MNETSSIKETIPFTMMIAVGFFITGFVTYAFLNGVTNPVYPPYAEHDWVFVGGWVAAWTVAGVLIGFYFGRK